MLGRPGSSGFGGEQLLVMLCMGFSILLPRFIRGLSINQHNRAGLHGEHSSLDDDAGVVVGVAIERRRGVLHRLNNGYTTGTIEDQEDCHRASACRARACDSACASRDRQQNTGYGDSADAASSWV